VRHFPAAATPPRANLWIIAAMVSLAAFMEVLDTSIANVALPYMARGLAASVDGPGGWCGVPAANAALKAAGQQAYQSTIGSPIPGARRPAIVLSHE
jgi:hypothetical protein